MDHLCYCINKWYNRLHGSSKRFKDNIKDLVNTEWLYSLRPVSFDWKEKGREPNQMGFIAEEVNEIHPQLVWLDKEGLPEGVHYEWLGIPIIVEMKKLKHRIEELESKLFRLENP